MENIANNIYGILKVLWGVNLSIGEMRTALMKNSWAG